jgi:hypothetical protein
MFGKSLTSDTTAQPRTELTKLWFETQKELVGKSDNNLTPHEWGKIKEKITDNVPY